VIHDCHADSEALFYLHGIRLGPLWDTQVAAGLSEVLQQLGSGKAEAPPKRAGLNAMLQVRGEGRAPAKCLVGEGCMLGRYRSQFSIVLQPALG